MRQRIFLILLAISLMLPPVDRFVDPVMSRHLLLQMAGLALCGFFLGLTLPSERSEYDPYGVARLLFFIATVSFWMIPRSMDLTVQNNLFDNIMQLNHLSAGFMLGRGVSIMPFVVKTAASIYGLSMLLTVGIAYEQYESLLCAVYDMEMQREAGGYILTAFPFVFALFVFRTAKNLIGCSRTDQPEIKMGD
jgi:hypothetical protein